jgi:HD-like signal output (HDOD) protein
VFRAFASKLFGDPKQKLASALGEAALPNLPAATLATLKLLRDAKVTDRAIAEQLAMDAALTVKLLRTVNSAAFGLRRKVDNVEHAMRMLGRGQVEALVLAVATSKAVPTQPVMGFEPSRYWRAAARRAATAKALADLVAPRTRMTAFTAGLLQDIALPLMAHRTGDRYGSLLVAWHTDGGQLEDLEQAELGYDHAEVGGLLAQKWDFSEVLAGAIGAHHGSAEGPAAVQLVGLIPEAERPEAVELLVETARERFGVAPDQVVEAVATGRETGDAFAAVLQG